MRPPPGVSFWRVWEHPSCAPFLSIFLLIVFLLLPSSSCFLSSSYFIILVFLIYLIVCAPSSFFILLFYHIFLLPPSSSFLFILLFFLFMFFVLIPCPSSSLFFFIWILFIFVLFFFFLLLLPSSLFISFEFISFFVLLLPLPLVLSLFFILFFLILLCLSLSLSLSQKGHARGGRKNLLPPGDDALQKPSSCSKAIYSSICTILAKQFWPLFLHFALGFVGFVRLRWTPGSWHGLDQSLGFRAPMQVTYDCRDSLVSTGWICFAFRFSSRALPLSSEVMTTALHPLGLTMQQFGKELSLQTHTESWCSCSNAFGPLAFSFHCCLLWSAWPVTRRALIHSCSCHRLAFMSRV